MYNIVEIPKDVDPEVRLFALSRPDFAETGRQTLFLYVFRDSGEYIADLGLSLHGIGEDIQDPYQMIAYVINTVLDKDADSRSSVFRCDRCNKIWDNREKSVTGYGRTDTDQIHCFRCCGEEDVKTMTETGEIVLYLTFKTEEYKVWSGSQYVTASHLIPDQLTNWPGSLRFNIVSWSKGDHNWGIDRYDLWFKGPDNRVWYGRFQGSWTQLTYCKSTKHTGYSKVVADSLNLSIEE